MCSAVGKMHPVGQAGSREVAVWQGAPGSMMVATSYIYNQSNIRMSTMRNQLYHYCTIRRFDDYVICMMITASKRREVK